MVNNKNKKINNPPNTPLAYHILNNMLWHVETFDLLLKVPILDGIIKHLVDPQAVVSPDELVYHVKRGISLPRLEAIHGHVFWGGEGRRREKDPKGEEKKGLCKRIRWDTDDQVRRFAAAVRAARTDGEVTTAVRRFLKDYGEAKLASARRCPSLGVVESGGVRRLHSTMNW